MGGFNFTGREALDFTRALLGFHRGKAAISLFRNPKTYFIYQGKRGFLLSFSRENDIIGMQKRKVEA